MKHELHRFRPVLAGNRCLGHLLYTIHGWQAHEPRRDRVVGTFPDADAAARRLQTVAASEAST